MPLEESIDRPAVDLRADSIWLCPEHGVVSPTHDPSCAETIRRYDAVETIASSEEQA